MAMTEKAFLEIEGSAGTRLPCMFNPASLSVSRGNDWHGQSIAGQGVPQVHYGGARSATMSLALTFDTTDSGKPVTEYTGKLMNLMEIDPDLPGTDPDTNNARPPYVIFHWGNLHSFKAVVTQLELRFTYFAATGTPLRAEATVSLMQFAESRAFGPQNPTSGTPRPHRVHRVQPGETLDRISARYYGDSTRWRAIAGANGISDPLALRPGVLLTIPRNTR